MQEDEEKIHTVQDMIKMQIKVIGFSISANPLTFTSRESEEVKDV